MTNPKFTERLERIEEREKIAFDDEFHSDEKWINFSDNAPSDIRFLLEAVRLLRASLEDARADFADIDRMLIDYKIVTTRCDRAIEDIDQRLEQLEGIV